MTVIDPKSIARRAWNASFIQTRKHFRPGSQWTDPTIQEWALQKHKFDRWWKEEGERNAKDEHTT